MISKSYSKQPFDIETIKIEWFNNINAIGISGYAISAAEAKIFDTEGIETTSTMIEGSTSYSGTDVFFTVKGGIHNINYYARIRVTLTKLNYETLYQEEDLLIKVKQIGS